jgi:hypothetical protein
MVRPARILLPRPSLSLFAMCHIFIQKRVLALGIANKYTPRAAGHQPSWRIPKHKPNNLVQQRVLILSKTILEVYLDTLIDHICPIRHERHIISTFYQETRFQNAKSSYSISFSGIGNTLLFTRQA